MFTPPRRPSRGRTPRPLLASAIGLALALAACDGTPTEGGPTEEPLGLRLSVAAASAGGPADAFRAADALHALVAREGDGSVLLEGTFPFDPDDEAESASIAVPVEESSVDVSIEITLLGGDEPLFRGGASATLRGSERTTAEVELEPVPGGLVVPERIEIDALHDTVPPGGAVLFATGDTIPGLRPVWTPDESGVVAVTPDGALVSLQEGEAEVLAGYDQFAETTVVQVEQQVAEVRVTPSAAEVPVGRNRRFEARPVDRQGFPLDDPTVEWSSSAPEIATVDATGLATGTSVGLAAIRAQRDGVTGEAELTVTPAEPGVQTEPADEIGASSATLHGSVDPREAETVAWFEWGPSTSLGNETPPQAVGEGTEAVPVERTVGELENDRVYYFRIAAENDAGVSRGEILSFRTLVAPPEAPSDLEASLDGGFVGLSWVDNSEIETTFEVQRAPSGTDAWSTIAVTESGVTEVTDREAPVGSALDYRVRACSPADCSPFSNVATILYGPDLLITSGPPDLEVSTFCPGDPIFISSSNVGNVGNLPSGSFGYGYYLSPDSTLDAGDAALGGSTAESLAPGAEGSVFPPEDLTIPEDASPGSYALGVLLDPDNGVPELDETNNFAGTPVEVISDCSLGTPPGGG